MRNRSVSRCAQALAVIAILSAAAAFGDTVRTIDDQSTVGTVRGFESDALIVQVKPGEAPRKIPLVEIAEVTFGTVAASPTDTTSGAKPPAGGVWTAVATVFGLPATPPAATTAPKVRAGKPKKRAGGAPPATAPAKTATYSAAKQPSGPEMRIEFAVGDHLTASLDAWSNDRVRLGLDGLDGAALQVPVDQIRAIWSTSEPLVKKAKDLKQTAEGQDIAFIEKNGDVKAVAGLATGIDAGYLKFKFEGEDHRIKLERIAGILLSQREIAPERSLFETFRLSNGDVLSGRIQSIEHDVLRLRPLFADGDDPGRDSAGLDLPLAQLSAIDVKNGRLTWVGDLHPSAVVQVPYFDRLMPFRVNESLTGGDLTLADGPVAKGIAVHTKCVLSYDIGGSFDRFRAKVGFQQPEGKAGRAALRVVGDGKVLWQQPDLRGDASQPAAIDVSVAKIQSLTLEADYGATYDVAGRIVWGEARLIKAPSPR